MTLQLMHACLDIEISPSANAPYINKIVHEDKDLGNVYGN